MSWNIKTPGDYINGPLTVAGNVGIGTTTFTSIAGYTSLKINNATNGAILDLAQGDAYKGRVIGSLNGLILESAVGLPVQIQVGGLNSFKADPAGVYTWYDGAGGTNQRMQLNSTGLGIGASPNAKLDVAGAATIVDSRGQVYIHTTDAAAIDIGAQLTLGGVYTGSNNYAFGGIAGRKENGTTNVAGYLDFLTTASNGALTSRARLNSTGAFVFAGGTQNANGVGIAFPGTQSASTDANTLDDYEEGTWTGTLKGGTTDPTTPVTATGRYTKIGRQVNIQLAITAATTTGASGAVQITGIPFAPGEIAFGVLQSENGIAFTGTLGCYINATATTIVASATASSGGRTDGTHNAGTNRWFWLNITYSV